MGDATPRLLPELPLDFPPAATTADAAAFPPSRDVARARLAALDAAAAARYARTRNHLDGAVTRLSPYFTHGVLTVPAAIAVLKARGVRADSKLVFELAWREYWQHAWRHLGEGILAARRAPPAPPSAYRATLPADLLEARTGEPVIDATVRTLYATGYVHNHARMWLAAYAVHLRKLDWRTCADWFYGSLLDGDLASNHLSWQWVAGTWTGKPYLANDENVARYAPALAHAGGALDRGYAELDRLARSSEALGPATDAPADGVAPPALLAAPPQFAAPPLATALPPLSGRSVALVHPWMLGERPDADVAIGIVHLPFHARFPWSAARWQFVHALAAPLVDAWFVGDLAALAPQLHGAARVSSVATLNFGYAEHLPRLATTLASAPRHFPDPPRLARSFSQFWHGPARS